MEQTHHPTNLTIGVTGHRPEALRRDAPLVAAVGTVLHLLECGPGTTVVSPLAEGADRLVATQAMERGAQLGAVLPFPVDRYLEDFTEPDSQAEFLALLAEAVWVVLVPPQPTADDAYLVAGQTVVDRTDVMVAIWDGRRARGRGGTADIVDYAVDRGVPVVWIRPGADPTTKTGVEVLGTSPDAQRILDLVSPSRNAPRRR